MTTIAYDGTSMSCDSQASCGFIEQSKAKKLHDIGDYIIAGSGSTAHILMAIDWFKGDKKEDLKFENDEIGGIFLVDKKTGMLSVFGPQSMKYPSIQPSFDPNALGSGEQFAMGALLQGATAEEAVKVACKLDKGSGGDVVTVRVKDQLPYKLITR